MIRISDKRKCMASLATFRNMYNKASIYDIIAELAKQTIVEKGVTSTNLDKFYNLFKEETGIDIPHSMLEASLKRLDFVEYDYKNITINEKLTKEECEKVKSIVEEQEQRNNDLFEALLHFVENELNRSLSPDESKSLINSLCSHIVDETYSGPFVEHVCSFILKNELTPGFLDYLNILREGTIIFVGYTYTAQDGYFDKIDTTINIYLETEILFHMAGYNGPLYKTLFDEFYTQVTEINKKVRKPLIKLFFFEETELEIDKYFKTACKVVERQEVPNPSKSAMQAITDGCSESYDVRRKQDAFLQMLSDHEILLDKQNSYNDVGGREFTIEHAKFMDMEDASEDRIYEKLKFLNNINVKRGGRPQKIFRNVGHVLLSGNSLTFRIASDDAIRPVNSIPLVLSLSALTNRFWLSLNKGLIPDMRLNNFNMIAKSRIALANKLKVSVSKIFNEIEEELTENKITLQQAKESLASLRRDSYNPDQINAEDVDKCISIIKNGELELYISIKDNEKRKEEERIAESERKVAEAEAKATDAEGKIARLQGISREMIKAIVDERNKLNEADHKKAMKSYNEAKGDDVDRLYKEYRNNQWKLLLCYGVFYLLLYFVVEFVTKKAGSGVVALCIGLFIDFVWKAIPFIRPVVSFDKLKKAYLFVTREDERDRVSEQFAQEYEKRNPQPVLHKATEEDIYKEFYHNIENADIQ